MEILKPTLLPRVREGYYAPFLRYRKFLAENKALLAQTIRDNYQSPAYFQAVFESLPTAYCTYIPTYRLYVPVCTYVHL